ncbi:vacuolar sorting protein, putative [Ichthyophthirius multifiliis]|uniref:Vacuolar sorting protein, putative n=1 Tax=Ichthyophthirius multifiliis TaxID=5932 RepID=G0QVE7_ICHMU|nr:vacuolar sorting protein, putative [Ichthyophthirius multifiliis]EGR30804.1 vacuolar sorting protein, putative [Ichthyophthirius multifiliis]|eukprot:XP_004032391.1 vacuolar sorting protein, putative [Ichthyophthirius multifiliis]
MEDLYKQLIKEKKHLIFDLDVKNVLSLTFDQATMKEYQVEGFSTIQNTQFKDLICKQVMIFIQPIIKYMEIIKTFIDANNKKNQQEKKNFTLVFWPKQNALCKQVLQQYGITENQVEVIDFSFDLIPLDQDVLSLELQNSFNNIYLDNDFSTFQFVAESIQRIQVVYGKIPNIFAKGDGAKIVLDILNQEQNIQNDEQQQIDIETLILLDRNIDLVTPLCSQLIYEGLLDDFYEVQGNILKVDSKILTGQSGKPQLIRISSENNQIYENIRSKQITQARQYLSSQAQEIQRMKQIISDKKKNASAEELQKCLKIVDKISQQQKKIEDHVNISLNIVERMKTIEFYKDLQIEQGIVIGVNSNQSFEYLEVLIGLGAPIQKVLKLFCLQSLVDKGIKAKELDFLRKEILHEYGFKHILTLYRLSQAGLLRKQDSQKNSWPKLREQLKLINDEVEPENPNDPAYTYSGYCPLTVRLIEQCLNKQSWKQIQEQLKSINGYQQYPEPQQYVKLQNKSAILVYIVGGVTFGEINAIRFLAKQIDREIIIASTHIINSKNIIQNIINYSN